MEVAGGQGSFRPAGPMQGVHHPAVEMLALTLEGVLLGPDPPCAGCPWDFRNQNLEGLCLRDKGLISSYFIYSLIMGVITS